MVHLFSDFKLVPYWLAAGVAIVLGFIFEVGPVIVNIHPTSQDFFEQDPYIGRPFLSSIVPTWLLVMLAGILPGVVIIAVIVVCQLRALAALDETSRTQHSHKARTKLIFRACTPSVTGLLIALGLTITATDLVKYAVGQKRPHFLARCNYKGYNDFLTNSNMEGYLNITKTMHLGDLSFCQASDNDIRDAQLSFLSGHASSSFAGLGFLSLWLYYVATHWLQLEDDELKYHASASNRSSEDEHKATAPRTSMDRSAWKLDTRLQAGPSNWTLRQIARVFCLVLPLIIAAFVATSRVMDNHHRVADILGGSILGYSIASAVFHGIITNSQLHIAAPSVTNVVSELRTPQHVRGSDTDTDELGAGDPSSLPSDQRKLVSRDSICSYNTAHLRRSQLLGV